VPGVGKNNKKHREELVANKMLTEMPNEPTGFIKLVSAMVGDAAEVAKPNDITTLDYESELCYVVGKRAHGVRKTAAMDYISGFTLTHDISAREIQRREVASGSRFWTAKNMPGFGPVGPFILTMDEVADTDNLWITCDVNGQRRLRANIGDYLYKISDVLEHFSRYVVFEAGDLIAMGAPSGVAVGQPDAAELYLKPGDDMVIGFEADVAAHQDRGAGVGSYPSRLRAIGSREPDGKPRLFKRFNTDRTDRSTATEAPPEMVKSSVSHTAFLL
jgi:acylpyruvate hydrolase